MSALPLFHETVRPEWIDYNGHMSEAFYVLVFGFATDALMDRTGVDAAYRERTGCSLYTVESHVRYLRDVPEGTALTVRTRVLGAAGKKVRFAHEMFAGGPEAVATIELLALYVDQKAGRAVPFPDDLRDRLAALAEPAPEWAGRSVTGP
ncbi:MULTISPECIES: thioesterase family protein [unclassified Streptomyces]|uniref:thioesterase family protein n=1 Tax=unclassified Streptomyces TaxID=2593676 RepID=UPI000DB9588E|nr:thioesterase family protein [Streptomyces sp. PsTaAH-137]MYT75638.1 thioesterase [Streptomyces sp. SID8367]RAJ87045.1 acyl-CoA thioester hydrolase [Streptomyces sp. PsTaAH-137]